MHKNKQQHKQRPVPVHPMEFPCLDASVSRMTARPSDTLVRREPLRSSRVKLSIPPPGLCLWTSSLEVDGGRTTWTVLCSGRSQPCHRRGQADSTPTLFTTASSMFNTTIPQGFSNVFGLWPVMHHYICYTLLMFFRNIYTLRFGFHSE